MRRRNLKSSNAENDNKLREQLFKKPFLPASNRRPQNYDRQSNIMKDRAEKTTDMLNSLVLRMSEQVKQSEETTSTLIHSSAVLKETHSHFISIQATVRSGGKLLSKYARRETTDKILIVLALMLYFSVIIYILRKRLPWFSLDWLWFI